MCYDRFVRLVFALGPLSGQGMTQAQNLPLHLEARGHTIDLAKCQLMGILNTTPDSFSDGGNYLDPAAAIAHATRLLKDGADIIDVGGMSTRPGSQKITPEEELKRVLPVIEGVIKEHPNAVLSIDTVHPLVAEAALEKGAHIINSVRALEDEPGLASLAAQSGAALILMHSSGPSEVMQDRTQYTQVPGDQIHYLEEQTKIALDAGVRRNSIIIDPGFGFGKTLEQNLAMLHKLDEFQSLGFAILVGLSRKSFLGQLSGIEDASQRDGMTHVADALAYQKGARILRVHDVAGAHHSLKLLEPPCSA